MKTTYVKSEIEFNGYYTIYLEDRNDRYLIIKVRNLKKDDVDRLGGPRVGNMNTGTFEYSYSGGAYFTKREMRPSTWDEIQWLEKCIEQDKLVNKDLCTYVYEIF